MAESGKGRHIAFSSVIVSSANDRIVRFSLPSSIAYIGFFSGPLESNIMIDASNLPLTLTAMANRPKKTAAAKRSRDISPIAKAFAARMDALCEANRISRLELARRSGVGRQFLWELSSGKKEPSLAVAAKIAEGLGTTLREMLPKE